MRLVGKNHVSMLVYRHFQSTVYNMSRNSLCQFPDYTNTVNSHVNITKVIRRLRVKNTDLDPSQVDFHEERFSANCSRRWYRWAVETFGRWFLKNFSGRWFEWERETSYGQS